MLKDKFVAHRGWQSNYPENTLIGIQAAISAGARHVEIDIQLSSDHIPILCHDHKLQRLCNSPLNINKCTQAQLQVLSVYEPGRLGDKFIGTPLATLEDCIKLIAQHPDVTLYVEIKRQSLRTFGHAAILAAVTPLLEKISSQSFIISFDIEILQQFKHKQWQKIAPVLSSWKQAFSKKIIDLSPPLLFCDIDLLAGKNLTELPYPCAIYEVDDYQQAVALVDQGAALIETFAVGEMITLDQRMHRL
ncbi:MAG: glycerophosphodiester phosphodiesterase family protein [Spongiibacteraceae bacterium]